MLERRGLERVFALRFVLLVLSFVVLASAPMALRAEPLQQVILKPGDSLQDVFRQRGVFLLDKQSQLSAAQAAQAARSGMMVANEDQAMQDWEREDRVWMAIELTADLQSREGPLPFVLGVEHLIYTPASMDLIRADGTHEPLLDIADTTTNQLFTMITSRQFLMEDGETVLALASTRPGVRLVYGDYGVHDLQNVARQQVAESAWQSALTLGLIFCAISLLIITPISGNRIGTALAIGYATFVLQANIETFLRAAKVAPWDILYVWTIVLCFNVCWGFLIFGYAFRKDFPRISKASIGFAILFALGFAADWIITGLPRDWLAFDLFWVSLILFVLVTGFKLPLAKPLRRLGFAIFIVVAVINFANTMLWDWLNFSDPVAEAIEDYSMLLVGLSFYVLVVTDILRSRSERRALTDQRITALEAQAESDRRLLETERQYARARDMATQRKRQLQSAGHDIRQPLTGLRTALRQEAEGLSSSLQDRLNDAIDYLDRLTREYGEDEDALEAGDQVANSEEEYPLNLVLSAMGDMFAGEAEATGIDLRVVPSTCQTKVPALALMRSVSNLVANAIRHSNASRVLVGVRHQQGCAIHVIDDGIGIAAEELEEMLGEGAKGNASQGEGLGLAIVSELGARHGFDFQLSSKPGRGTAAQIRLPKG